MTKRAILCMLALAARRADGAASVSVKGADDNGKDAIHGGTRGNERYRLPSTESIREMMALADDAELASTQAVLRDYAFTKSLRDALSSGPGQRNLQHAEEDETCLPNGKACDGHGSDCCRGGCSSAKTCYCQASGGICFNFGAPDLFCCSNECGDDGRCRCIAAGESCAVGSTYCCPGLTCGDDKKCALELGGRSGGNNNKPARRPTGGFFALEGFDDPLPVKSPTKRPTKRPTRRPTKRPTRRPTRRPTMPKANQAPSSNGSWSDNGSCKGRNQPCDKRGRYDPSCCDRFCGDHGRCQSFRDAFQHDGSSPTRRPTRRPTVRPTNPPTGRPTFLPEASPYAKGGLCRSDPSHIRVRIEVETDKFGSDVAWFVAPHRPHAPKVHDVNGPAYAIVSFGRGTYGAFSKDAKTMCVPPGRYNFTLTDEFGDGMCCAYGEGNVKIFLDNREVMHAKSWGRSITEIISAGYDPNPQMSRRDGLYLEAHNRRRSEWFAREGKKNVPLAYSPALAEQSRVWANKLLVNCSIADILHEPGVREGENLAKNTGTVGEDGLGWGQLYPPDNILRRWVEFEIYRPYPGNAHLTQALWRPARYMGCGESFKKFRKGVCRVQVCRYARAGNCEMSRFDATTGKNWLPPMLADTSRCGPNAAPEGLF